MSQIEDLKGQRFDRLVVQRLAGLQPTRWLCSCLCGEITTVVANRLKSGKTRSCGCLRRENSSAIGKANVRHGMKGTSEWRSWSSMMARHRASEGPYAKIYVYRRWHKFETFLKDMGMKPSPSHSIDRKDNDKGYMKSNCRWATKKEQANNRRNNR